MTKHFVDQIRWESLNFDIEFLKRNIDSVNSRSLVCVSAIFLSRSVYKILICRFQEKQWLQIKYRI